ncbi:MAG: glycosyl hydrolase [Rubrivivax sp.]
MARAGTTPLGRQALAAACGLLLAVAGGGAAAAGAATVGAPQLGVYKDVTLSVQADTGVWRSAVQGSVRPLAQVLRPGLADVLYLAFAVGECGEETWSGQPAAAAAAANVPLLAAAGQRYVLSTGGALGVFTCDSDAGLDRFIARHASPQLVGVDFDIEGAQTPAQIDALAQRIASGERRHPALQFSVTLATHAGVDAARAGLNATGRAVLQALQRHGAQRTLVNLMVMDYGPASPAVCPLRPGVQPARCDMGRAGLQAARNVAAAHGLPLSRIALTAMVGVNDVLENVFTLDDARQLAADARSAGLAGVAYWSLDRDRPCEQATVVATCHTLPPSQVPQPLDFARALAQGLGR